ncbi:GntP family permease [Chromohalobacter israelensis]|uniref:GntP family permease n=1 Tax=Chromohalobacter israelensis TaxID=141390 RepID=UPI0005524818|nr:SLC13 family permease [Chromohalobacter israelensis]MDF9434137.1 GntP family permease [Chromohalobacter israelensis]
MLSLIGLVGGLALLIILTMRGVNLLIAAPLAALFMAALNGLPLLPPISGEDLSYVHNYMGGFTSFISSWFFMFLMGAIFGKLMQDSGAAESISKWIIRKLGFRNAALAIVIACAVLTYGGVSLFIVAFSVYPMAVSLFREANLPRRFIPAALGFGSTTFTMTSAGSPEIQNWIPIEYLHTSPYAAWEVSAIVALFMMVVGQLWLNRMIKKAVARGESFEDRSDDITTERESMPNAFVSLIPLMIVLLITFFFHHQFGKSALIIALLSGVIATCIINIKHFDNIGRAFSEGAMGALIAIANTAAVVGFGGVAKATPAFDQAVQLMTSLPGDPLIGSAIAICVIAGLTGSASGGQAIALPLLAPHYLDMGVNSESLHRVAAISSGALDSLPHGGYVVTTIRAIAGETHKDAYPAFGKLTVVVPLLGVVLAILLFMVGL